MNPEIEKITSSILKEFDVNSLPIPIEKIIKSRGLKLKAYDLGDDISGVLVLRGNKGYIGYNPSHPKVRQRFTVAHEFGHFVLHGLGNNLFIDKKFTVLYRDSTSSTGELKMEQEANAFAAAFLMPEKILLKEIRSHKYDLTEENTLKELAKSFNVSTSAMTFRIANLNLFYKL